MEAAKQSTSRSDPLTIAIYLDGVLQASGTDWQRAVAFTFTPSGYYGTHVIAIEATNQGGPGGVIVDVR